MPAGYRMAIVASRKAPDPFDRRLTPLIVVTPLIVGWRSWRQERLLTCSVENLCGSNDHHIMCDDPEDDLAALAPVRPRPQGGTEATFDHRVDRLRLPPL